MIPNAVASIGPFAELWSHLKSIDHALERSLDSKNAESLTELDKERLHALVELLQMGVAPASPEPVNLLTCATPLDPDYGSSINLRERISTLPAFESWKKSSRLGFEPKVQKLIDAIQGFVVKPPGSLFPKDAPRQELEVLRAIVQDLLFDAEAALQQ